MIRFLWFATLFSSIGSFAQPSTHYFITGRTTGALPYLKYGLGEDRLGGAKMTFLDTSIVIKVVDSVKDDYRVQLSNSHFAYLPKEDFKRDNALKIPPYYLSDRWDVTGDEKYDYIKIPLSERLPYKSMQEINPSKIIVDVFGVTSNTNWITQHSTAKEIKNTYFEQPEDDVFRVIIELNHPQHWGYRIYYEEKNLVIRIKRQPGNLELSALKIAIDAGHGGNNGGAEGVTSRIAEKNYTLLFAQELEKKLLDEKSTVFMTREKDTSLSMVERIGMLKEQEPDLLVSLHLNSSDYDSIEGVGTFYRYIGFRPLTLAILKRMQELGLKEYANVGSFNFALSGPTDYPNCLVEIAFLSNKEDEKRILDPEFRKEVAEKIAEGIKDWLNSCK